jgi:hypothetical protein
VLSIYVVFQMAGRQRRGQNERVPPPPPPPPTLQELMAQQNEISRQLAQRQPPPQHYGGLVVETISVTPRQLPIRSSSVPSHLCSQGQRTHLMQMCGCEWWNPNSRYSMELVLRSLKSGSPPSSFADPQGLGGTIFLPCSQRIERWNGESSRQLSGDTTYQRDYGTKAQRVFGTHSGQQDSVAICPGF